jgi:hypothetical protein
MFELFIIIAIFIYVRNRKKKDLLYYYQQKELEEKSKELNFVEYKKKQIEQNQLNNNRKQIENKNKKTTILVSSFFIYIVSLYCTMLITSDDNINGNGTKGMGTILAVFIFIITLVIYLNSVSKNKGNKDISNFVQFQYFTLLIFLLSFVVNFVSGTVAFLISQTILIVAFMLLFKRNSY